MKTKMLVKKAFDSVPRRYFVLPELRYISEIDSALSIGYGQTISQPTTVRFMLGWLNAQPGDKVLDVGSGSGWTTALISNIVGSRGKVFAVERIPELVEFGRQNCKRLGIKNVTFFQAGKYLGLPSKQPFDRILVSASAKETPSSLIRQLKIGGTLIVPVGYDILEIIKLKVDQIKTVKHPDFIFVPLIEYGVSD